MTVSLSATGRSRLQQFVASAPPAQQEQAERLLTEMATGKQTERAAAAQQLASLTGISRFDALAVGNTELRKLGDQPDIQTLLAHSQSTGAHAAVPAGRTAAHLGGFRDFVADPAALKVTSRASLLDKLGKLEEAGALDATTYQAVLEEAADAKVSLRLGNLGSLYDGLKVATGTHSLEQAQAFVALMGPLAGRATSADRATAQSLLQLFVDDSGKLTPAGLNAAVEAFAQLPAAGTQDPDGHALKKVLGDLGTPAGVKQERNVVNGIVHATEGYAAHTENHRDHLVDTLFMHMRTALADALGDGAPSALARCHSFEAMAVALESVPDLGQIFVALTSGADDSALGELANKVFARWPTP